MVQNSVGSTIIKIPDNSRQGEQLTLSDIQRKDLDSIANKKLCDLCDENNTLLIFPSSLNKELKNEHICKIEENKIFTKNIMGFVGKGDTRLRIYSRFDTKETDYFLHYMLAKVHGINLFDLPYTSDPEPVFDFLIFLFPDYLRRAMARGIYKQYVTFDRNDSNVRGPIDIARHIRRNIPFTGSIAYRSRDYCGDNEMTELVRHTIEYISTLPDKATILEQDDDIRRSVAEIREATPSFNPKEAGRVISRNLRPKVHPYYSEYEPLRKLCIQILMKEKIKYGEMEDTVYGVLFDGAWLWEEYLNIVLSNSGLGFKHPNSLKDDRQGFPSVFNSNKCPRYPDFYNDQMVLDAKYKKYGDEWPSAKKYNEDLAQVISYLYIKNIRLGGFLLPGKGKESDEELNGIGGKLFTLRLTIPASANSFSEFCRSMKTNEEQLIGNLRKKNQK